MKLQSLTTQAIGEEGSKRWASMSRRIAIAASIGYMVFGGLTAATAVAEPLDLQSLSKEEQALVTEDMLQTLVEEHLKGPDGLSYEEKVTAIRNFFTSKNMPAAQYAEDFVKAAETYNLDHWALPAAIATIETTGCKYTLQNHETTKRKMNCFGYGNFDFENIPAGIDYVTKVLAGEHAAMASYYDNKSLAGKLLSYNTEDPRYYTKIITRMSEIVKPTYEEKA